MVERSLQLLTKIVILLFLFPLGQFGSEFKFWSAAEMTGNNEPGPVPEAERDALNMLKRLLPPEKQVSGIKSSREYNINKICNDKSAFSSITVNCTPIRGTHHITVITMVGESLSGRIPDSVGNLTYLETLDLSSNQIHGSIPPTLGNLTHLTKLSLDNNLLNGKIPSSLGNLSSLEVMSLWSNQLSHEIPPELGRLSQLRMLALDENGLTGTSPPELGKLSNLQELWLASNNLNGELPKEYVNLSNLVVFDVSGNNLSGHIPEYVTNWRNLYALALTGNNFEGKLPPAIFNMSSLRGLWVSNLKNPGFPFPESANLRNIATLVLTNCNITGKIPSYIANWSTLKFLDLSFNNLIMGVPENFKNLPLSMLYLQGNKLNGTFPYWINEAKTINKGDLSYNNFKFFDDPKSHGYLQNNKDATKINTEPRNSTFPQEIMDKHCHGKKYDSLFINAGGGEELTNEGRHYENDNSTSNFYVSSSYNWAYSCNGLFALSEMNSSNFIQNTQCGVHMPKLHENARYCPQSLRYYVFCLRKGNYTVQLEFSEIVFAKSENYSSNAQRVFDINIQGNPVLKDFNIRKNAGGPNKIWTKKWTVSVHDNLLRIELLLAGKGSTYYRPYLNGPLISAISITPNFKVQGGLSTKEIVGIVISVVSALLLLLAVGWRMGWFADKELRVATVNIRGKSYTIKQVRDATRNFSPRNVIGTGRFGTVYKAELPDQIAAVKKLSPQSKQVIDQIGTEVYALKNLKHENIVEFFDGYSTRDLHLLIYEYTEKGSLEQALFDANSTTRLDWPTRARICLGIAKGLKYLHEDNPTRKIVHRNIKPSNVLLDGNFNAKVSDLGLAKLYDEENPYKFIQEKGTVVYMAPEYATHKAITEKVDVFSFGIVLLEIVSGRTNAYYAENQETDFLLDTAIVLHMEGKLYDLVDKHIPNNHDLMKQAIKVLELAMKCVDLSPTLRPTMSHVVSVLEQICEVEIH